MNVTTEHQWDLRRELVKSNDIPTFPEGKSHWPDTGSINRLMHTQDLEISTCIKQARFAQDAREKRANLVSNEGKAAKGNLITLDLQYNSSWFFEYVNVGVMEQG